MLARHEDDPLRGATHFGASSAPSKRVSQKVRRAGRDSSRFGGTEGPSEDFGATGPGAHSVAGPPAWSVGT
jgi:hypothetical protein